jgi:serine O-acetyltransferase
MKDPASKNLYVPFLFHKGYHALQLHRVAASYWHRGNTTDATLLSSICATKFSVDIHPAAVIGSAVFIDHANGVVIGETARIGDNTTLFHGVTLGSKGKHGGDRHPKVGKEVFIGANAIILGNITIGDFSYIGAGAVVLRSVPERHLAVGVPAENKMLTEKHNVLNYNKA